MFRVPNMTIALHILAVILFRPGVRQLKSRYSYELCLEYLYSQGCPVALYSTPTRTPQSHVAPLSSSADIRTILITLDGAFCIVAFCTSAVPHTEPVEHQDQLTDSGLKPVWPKLARYSSRHSYTMLEKFNTQF